MLGPVQTPLWLDLAAVTTSAIGGSLVAVRAKFDVTGVFALGILTGLGGGVLSDLMTTKPPAIFQRSHLYATAAFVGLVVYAVAIKAGAPATETAIFAAALIFGLLIIARSRDWKAPQPIDVPQEIRKRRDTG